MNDRDWLDSLTAEDLERQQQAYDDYEQYLYEMGELFEQPQQEQENDFVRNQ